MDVQLRGEMMVDGRPVPPDTRAGLLIAYLCLAPNQRSIRESLASELWPNQSREDQFNSLRQTIHLAKKLGKVYGDRSNVWIDLHSSDFKTFDTWSPLLPDWQSSWAERARELDRQQHSERTLRQSAEIADPIGKIELLKEGLRADPLDEELCADLVELYQALGWRTEAAIQIRSFDRAIREADVGLTSSKMLRLLRPFQDCGMQNRHGLSRQQNIELTLANFPAQFASGQLQLALDSLEAVLLEGGLSVEQEAKLTYFKVRCLLYLGQATLALETAKCYPDPPTLAYDRILKSYELYLTKQFVEASEYLVNEAELESFPDELFCDAMGLLATVAIMSFKPEVAARAIEDGSKRANEIGYRYSSLSLKVLHMNSEQIWGSAQARLTRYDELIDYAQRFGFILQLNGLLSSKGKTLRELGRLAEAEATLLECIANCDKVHSQLGLGIALDYLGETYLSMERYSDAALQFQRSALLRREFGEHIGMATSYRGAGLALIGMKEFRLASKLLRKCLAIYQQAEDTFRVGVCCIFLAIAEEGFNDRKAQSAWKVGIRSLEQSKVDQKSVRYELGQKYWEQMEHKRQALIGTEPPASD